MFGLMRTCVDDAEDDECNGGDLKESRGRQRGKQGGLKLVTKIDANYWIRQCAYSVGLLSY